MAKDPERGRDSLVTFEEILQIAQEKKAIILLYIDSTIFIPYVIPLIRANVSIVYI